VPEPMELIAYSEASRLPLLDLFFRLESVPGPRRRPVQKHQARHSSPPSGITTHGSSSSSKLHPDRASSARFPIGSRRSRSPDPAGIVRRKSFLLMVLPIFVGSRIAFEAC